MSDIPKWFSEGFGFLSKTTSTSIQYGHVDNDDGLEEIEICEELFNLLFGIPDEAPYWWLSFCDGDKPDGQQFLGAVIIKAIEPVSQAWKLGLNPGGEVMIVKIPQGAFSESELLEHGNKLLSREYLEKHNLI